VFGTLGVKRINAHQSFGASEIHVFQSIKDNSAGFIFAIGGHPVFKVEDHSIHIQAGGLGNLL